MQSLSLKRKLYAQKLQTRHKKGKITFGQKTQGRENLQNQKDGFQNLQGLAQVKF